MRHESFPEHVARSPGEPVLVSVILPVRNGAQTLKLVIDGLLGQTYRNIELLISDNASTDATSEICREAMTGDTRVRYVRQSAPITARDNFMYWLREARGKYVLFAAHDDLRNQSYIAALVSAFQDRPYAVCAMPRVFNFNKYVSSPFEVLDPTPAPPTDSIKRDSSLLRRCRVVVVNGIPIYGLIRADILRRYPWFDIDYGPDLPFAVFLAMYGELYVCSDAIFYYWTPLIERAAEERAVQNSFSPLKPFGEVRLAWTCGLAASAAMTERGIFFPPIFGCVAVYSYRKWHRIKGYAYVCTPGPLRALWRRIKVGLGLQPN